ncbi:MAG: shikimate kinase [Eubacteriales bacterium]|nr:shikimate kinase [Eubacteriales bacterium]
MNNIIFIGMPASGKSTVGVILAKRLGYDFVDTDLLIQKQEGCLLKDIIAEKGTEGFVKIEDQVNAGVQAENTVISPGGSVVYCENAMRHFKEIGTVVYLQTSYETIKKRIGNPKKRGVVLKDGQTLKDLFEERRVLFEKYADVIISEDGLTLDETIDKVVGLFD